MVGGNLKSFPHTHDLIGQRECMIVLIGVDDGGDDCSQKGNDVTNVTCPTALVVGDRL